MFENVFKMIVAGCVALCVTGAAPAAAGQQASALSFPKTERAPRVAPPSSAPLGTIVVTVATPVLPSPQIGGVPMRVAKEGSIVTALDSTGDWYRIEFNDPERGPSIGFIQKRDARLEAPAAMTLQPVSRAAEAPAQVPAQPVSRPVDAPTPAAPQPASSVSIVRSDLNENVRRGFWFNGGLGYGSIGCLDCSGREGGLSGNLTFGGTVSDRFLIGFGTAGFVKNVDGTAVTLGHYDARIRFYPSRTNGFFVTGGAGIGVASVSALGLSESEIGFSALLGLGYDIRVGRNVSVTPFWNGFALSNSNGDLNVGQVGIGVTIH